MRGLLGIAGMRGDLLLSSAAIRLVVAAVLSGVLWFGLWLVVG